MNLMIWLTVASSNLTLRLLTLISAAMAKTNLIFGPIYMENLKSKFHVIILTETWSTSVTEDLVTYPGYKTYAKSRVNGIRGGVAILVDEDLHSQLADFECSFISEVEYLLINITLKANSTMLIASIYRPPGSDPHKFNIDMINLNNSMVNSNKICYICGDFNLNLMNYDSHAPTNEFLNNMFSSGFRPLITSPTRLTEHSATLIDNILSNALTYKGISGILYAHISDHLPIFVILDCKLKLLPKPKLVIGTKVSRHLTILMHSLKLRPGMMSLFLIIFRGVHPPEAMMHFPPVSDSPPLFWKQFVTFWKIFKILPFPEQISHFHPPKFLTTFFLVIDHKFWISPLFCLFYKISPPDSRKFIISPPVFQNFPSVFQKFYSLLRTLRVFPPLL